MVIRMLQSVACPQYVAAMGSVYECPKEIGKHLLGMRDERGKAIAEVVTSPNVKAVRLRLNKEEEEVYGLDGSDE